MFLNQGKMLLLIVLTLAVGLLVNGCAKPGANNNQDSNQVAIVNGDVLDRQEFDKLLQQSKATFEAQHGINFADKENKEMLTQVETMVLDEMINETVLLQHASKAGIDPSQKEVQAELEAIRATFTNAEQFKEALQHNDITLEELEQEIFKQIKIERYLQQALPQEQITVSEEEITAFYNKYKTEMEGHAGEKAPLLAELKAEIAEMLQLQKLDEAKATLLEKLRNESEIITYLN